MIVINGGIWDKAKPKKFITGNEIALDHVGTDFHGYYWLTLGSPLYIDSIYLPVEVEPREAA